MLHKDPPTRTSNGVAVVGVLLALAPAWTLLEAVLAPGGARMGAQPVPADVSRWH